MTASLPFLLTVGMPCLSLAVTPPLIEAHFTTSPIVLDGLPDEPAWEKAEIYAMELPQNKQQDARQPKESGTVQVAWDQTRLYFAFEFLDSGLVAEGMEDELHHYKLGDVAEVFLKPKKNLILGTLCNPRRL